jgi:hypothetical protein
MSKKEAPVPIDSNKTEKIQGFVLGFGSCIELMHQGYHKLDSVL